MRCRLIRVLPLVAAVLASGCHVIPPKQDAALAPSDSRFTDLPRLVPAPVPRSEDERLYPGDAVVFKVDEDPPTVQPRVEVMAVVQEDFTVTWLSNKVFNTTGKTYEEFRQEVHDYYVPALFKNVRLMETDPPFYIVRGEVWSPGFRTLYRPTTVLKAIESAGGFTPSANKKKVQLIRVGRERRIMNCTNIRRLEEDVEVLRGDYIHVPRSFWK